MLLLFGWPLHRFKVQEPVSLHRFKMAAGWSRPEQPAGPTRAAGVGCSFGARGVRDHILAQATQDISWGPLASSL